MAPEPVRWLPRNHTDQRLLTLTNKIVIFTFVLNSLFMKRRDLAGVWK